MEREKLDREHEIYRAGKEYCAENQCFYVWMLLDKLLGSV